MHCADSFCIYLLVLFLIYKNILRLLIFLEWMDKWTSAKETLKVRLVMNFLGFSKGPFYTFLAR